MNKKLPGRDLTVFSLLFTRYCSARNFRTFCAEILSFSARNRILVRFLCIVKRVTGHGENSNVFSWRQCFITDVWLRYGFENVIMTTCS